MVGFLNMIRQCFLTEIETDWKGCLDCELAKGRTNQVWYRLVGEGVEEGQMVMVGEAPGATEDEVGLPFVGRAGKKLDSLMAKAGITRAAITNMVVCRPPKNRAPTSEEVEACQGRLHRFLFQIRPKVIVTIGSTASVAILEVNKPITYMMGRVWDWTLVTPTSDPFTDLYSTIVPILHPSYLLRQRSTKLDQSVVSRLELAWRIQTADKSVGRAARAKI